MNWLRRFFYGRNGPDQLSLATLIAGMILLILSNFIRFTPALVLLQIFYFISLFFFFYRTLSRNLYKRQAENYRFLQILRPVREWFSLRRRMFQERRTYKYLRCPSCKQRLRVPRGKGKIRVTCKSCGNLFDRKV